MPLARLADWCRAQLLIEADTRGGLQAALRAWLPAGTPGWIASGAGLGALRGESLVGSAEALLADLEKQAEMLLAQGIDPL